MSAQFRIYKLILWVVIMSMKIFIVKVSHLYFLNLCYIVQISFLLLNQKLNTIQGKPSIYSTEKYDIKYDLVNYLSLQEVLHKNIHWNCIRLDNG